MVYQPRLQSVNVRCSYACIPKFSFEDTISIRTLLIVSSGRVQLKSQSTQL